MYLCSGCQLLCWLGGWTRIGTYLPLLIPTTQYITKIKLVSLCWVSQLAFRLGWSSTKRIHSLDNGARKVKFSSAVYALRLCMWIRTPSLLMVGSTKGLNKTLRKWRLRWVLRDSVGYGCWYSGDRSILLFLASIIISSSVEWKVCEPHIAGYWYALIIVPGLSNDDNYKL